MLPMDDLASFFGKTPPFDALAGAELQALAAAAQIVDVDPDTQIVDAFAAPSTEVFVVLSGQVEMWNNVEGAGPADEVICRGGVFGFSAMPASAAVGPLAVALGPVQLARIPGTAVAAAFSSAAGVRFVAQNLMTTTSRTSPDPTFGVVDELIVSAPVIATPSMTVAEVAALMTEHHSRYAVLPLAGGGFGLVTDALLRATVTAPGLPADTAISQVLLEPAPTVVSGTPAAQALLELTDRELDCLLVTDQGGALHGIVTREDFIVSPSTAGVSLREQIVRIATVEQLILLARRAPLVVGDLLRCGRSVSEVTTVYSTVVDAIVGRALALVLADHSELEPAQLTWLALGSNGRREPVLSSDVDAAVVFADSVATAEAALAYRTAFDEVAALLGRCRLTIDIHGATPGMPLFARTGSQWKEAAQRWISAPLENKGMLMTALLLDARPIQGDPRLPVVNDVFGDMHGHPGTLRLLLAESLSNRARLRSMRDMLARRGGTFDIKTHALRPVIDIARWAALAVGSKELSTRARLAAAAGSPMVPDDDATTLTEAFDLLQRIRLEYQLAQIDRGEPPADVLLLGRLSPLDRSLIGQAVREIAAVQRRMFNLSQLASPDTW